MVEPLRALNGAVVSVSAKIGRRSVVRVLKLLCILAGLAGCGLAGLRLAARWSPLPQDYFQPGSQVIEFHDRSPAFVFLSPDEKWRIRMPPEEIDPAYLRALLRLEDKRFYDHGGVDIWAVLRAAVLNLSRGRVVSGASTLTMQLVRVREPRPRTLRSKMVEAFRAWQIEARYSKAQILTAYLEYVPFGRNVEGVEAAALSYFGHRANALSAAEIATLLAVPQNPARRFPSERNQRRLKLARDDIARRLIGWGALTQPGVQPEALVEIVSKRPVPSALRRFPRLAPHAAMWLRAEHPNNLRVHTTLDRGTQKVAERTLAQAAVKARQQGILNGAAVVLDHASGKVRALVGSFDFWGAQGGQIIGFDNPRSPGSALKPLIYALAIDHQLALPEHLVLDVPFRYGSYTPKNYDGKFSGLVELEDALSRSLNVPFVNLLARLGVDRFIGDLQVWGVESIKDEPEFYGLSAAIGGLELTPLELAGLYAMIAQGGRFSPVRWLEGPCLEVGARGCGGDPIRGLSEGAAHLTRRALRLKDRPDFPARRRFTGLPAGVHWKTGTSYGHRDAWAAGSAGDHTAAVWLGNFDNRPSVNLVGAQAAGPVLFDLLEAFEVSAAPEDRAPHTLKEVEVCAYSGRAAGPGCPHTKRILALRTAVPTEVCPYHIALDVDDKTGLAIRPGCRSGARFQTRQFLVWPARLRRHLAMEHRHLPHPPAWAPGCEMQSVAQRVAIVSPPANHVALLMPGVDAADQEIPLEAEAASKTVAWFVDGAYLGTQPAAERLWWKPKKGAHEIVVVDESGHSASRKFWVKEKM